MQRHTPPLLSAVAAVSSDSGIHLTAAASGDEVNPLLDEDAAYISEVKITEKTTGTAPFDDDDEPGNDSNADNNILRTYDTASYTVGFTTKLHNSYYMEYATGRVYFEIILPASAEQAQFGTTSMGWLQTASEIAYTIDSITIDGSDAQVLRGSYMLTPTDSNPAAVGASYNEVTVVIRALKMKNGDTLTPSFTFWLQYNDIGAQYNDAGTIPTTLVTENGKKCAEHNLAEYGTASHTLTISAAPMYNVQLFKDSTVSNIGTYNFDATDNKDAINYGLGAVYGRLAGYGIIIEIKGKTGQGMRGVELPDGKTDITFDLTMTSAYKTSFGTYDNAEYQDNYRLLFWSGGGNLEGNAGNADKRVTTENLKDYLNDIPLNEYISTYKYGSCYDGGIWSFEADSEDDTLLHVTVSGCTINTDQFPYSNVRRGATQNIYYDSDVQNYWEIEEAIFSVGELWVMQPYTGLDNGTDLEDKYGEGQYINKFADSNFEIKDAGENGNIITTSQRVTSDDSIEHSDYLMPDGMIQSWIYYLKYKGIDENGNYSGLNALTDGCIYTDNDWAVAGQQASISVYMEQSGAEGDTQTVAFDQLVKFDADFFDLESVGVSSSVGTSNMKKRVLYAAKSDGGNWENDEEMKQTTEDDLVYYATLTALKNAGVTCVAVLMEWRGICDDPAGNCEYALVVSGTIKEDCDTDTVYMTTYTNYAWSKNDVKEATAKFCGKDESKLTNSDYTTYAINADNDANGFPSRKLQVNNNKSGTSIIMLDEDHQFTVNYLKPFWRKDYYYCNGNGESATTVNNLMMAKCSKATYDANGYHTGVGQRYYQDSCYVVDYRAYIEKSTAQIESSTNAAKSVYDLNHNQVTVDYVLSPRFERQQGENDNTAGGSTKTTTVYIQDTLPVGMTYISGTSYLGGTYTQDDSYKTAGTVTGGEALEPTVTTNADGTTTLAWSFRYTFDLVGKVTYLPNIYYSCTLSGDLANGTGLSNEVKVWTTELAKIDCKKEWGNLTSYGISVTKANAISISKLADYAETDWWDKVGFTMNVGNNSANNQADTIIVDTLPFNGLNKTSFDGALIVEELLATLSGYDDLGDLTFYYTTNEDYKGWTGEDFLAEIKSTDSSWTSWQAYMSASEDWTQLDATALTDTDGGYSYEITGFPNETEQKNAGVVAIVAVGTLPAGQTLQMHISLSLPDGKEGDLLFNYLSADNLTSYAYTKLVSRTLEGLTWLDTNANGVQNEGENVLNGVKVSLWRLKDGGDPTQEDDYEPVCYPGTNTQIVLKTGEKVSAQAESAEAITAYDNGRYLFTDLPVGTYMVKFESSEDTDISVYLASPYDQGDDDTIDSDGVPTYDNTAGVPKLKKTVITGINITRTNYTDNDAKYHDSGFFIWTFELPDTGGAGTAPFTVCGLAVLLCAGFLVIFRRRGLGLTRQV